MKVTDEELRESIAWYKDYYRSKTTNKSIFETYLCGYFHSYPKGVRPIIDRMKELGLVKMKQGMVEVQ
jgi:hypothetical protein